MSDTRSEPHAKGSPQWCVWAIKHIDELERENAELREGHRLACERTAEVLRELGELRRYREELDELRRDKERLDWLLTCHPPYEVILGYAFDAAWDTKIILDSRAALDKAMKERS